MPTYEYVCTECEEKVEIRATIAEKERGLKPSCPKCGSKKVAQVFGFMIMGGSKGGGFNSGSVSGCGPSAGPGCCF